MLYTLFGWLDIEDWQMMLGWGVYYGIPCDVQLAEEEIIAADGTTSVGRDVEDEDHDSVMVESDESDN